MNPGDDARAEERLADLLAATARDAVPPDAAALDRIRTTSAAEFAAAPPPRRRFMPLRYQRLSAAAAVLLAAAGIAAWLLPDRGPTLRRALENTGAARALYARLTRLGKTAEVWVRRPGLVRIDPGDGPYQVARDGKVFDINEADNRAASRPTPYGTDQVDLLALAQVPLGPERQSLLDRTPVGEVEHDGRPCLLYRGPVDAAGLIQVEALVEKATGRLVAVETFVLRGGQAVPLAALAVLTFEPRITDEKFAVKDTLTEDGRVGKVSDAQGLVAVRPAQAERWSPVRANLVLKPGDWVRTDLRGANAAALKLAPATTVILGPGTLVEVAKPDQIKILSGELEIASGKTNVELTGPKGDKTAVAGTKRFRVAKDEQLAALEAEPAWLKGFKGAVTSESLGSLIAKVDGRDVPLTVGYHKVSVDVRDQIARTTIEESFVNRTNARLEGVFYFPLPQDASIAGFGMWIGNELVEADVVEKQRAREIYETIKRERRDPGLLEWAGGNVFTARVFPIEANSEKRVKIQYTQVLPLRGSRYRYSYGLRSEMLQQTPLRELGIDVTVSSAVPLKAVTCPTHPTRGDLTPHAASVHFTAQEYRPTRDFEVVVETESRPGDVVLIPHRRGDDGYFLLQLTPPAGPGNWEREIVPEAAPMHLLILADTSASMDPTQRAAQANVIGAMLTALTPKDRFNLAGCDVATEWAFPAAVAADTGTIDRARGFLAGRSSLGWTDLPKAFGAVLTQVQPGTHVVYVGDGIQTATNGSDPAATGRALKQLLDGKGCTVHAVAVGSTFEPTILKALATIGGGSFRRASAEQGGPQGVALELLREIAQPGLKDLKVEFRGLRTARVYPAVVPNVAAGTQQIILGRYLPEGKDQAGEVVISATQAGQPVTYRSQVRLKDAEAGNAFIPRLWARMYLDQLLEQGQTEAVKEDVIALSEEYHILTPYTSFLVLETDADRQRFGVKRRFQMRDGQQFFQQARDDAKFALMQQAMKRAAGWRLELRRGVLQELATLGRDRSWLEPQRRYRRQAGLGGMMFGGLGGGGLGCPEPISESIQNEFKGRMMWGHRPDGLSLAVGEPAGDVSDPFGTASEGVDLDDREKALGDDDAKDELREDLMQDLAFDGPVDRRLGKMAFLGRTPALEEAARVDVYDVTSGESELAAALSDAPTPMFSPTPGFYRSRSQSWLQRLFPVPTADPRSVKMARNDWPAEARDLSRKLLRTDRLALANGGLEVVTKTEGFRLQSGELDHQRTRRDLFAPGRWVTRTGGDTDRTEVQWCADGDRGAFTPLTLLGQVRPATGRDRTTPPLHLDDFSLPGADLERGLGHLSARLEPDGQDRVRLVLSNKEDADRQVVLVIDTARNVLLSMTHRHKGTVSYRRTFEDFVQVAGSWWAQREETFDGDGRRTGRTTRTVKVLAADAYAQAVKGELELRPALVELCWPLPTLATAKGDAAANKATLGDRWVLLLWFAGKQLWARAGDQLDALAKLMGEKTGVRWLRIAFAAESRKHETLKNLLLAELTLQGAKADSAAAPDDLALTQLLIELGGPYLAADEMLRLLDAARPLYLRQPAHLRALKSWDTSRAHYLGAAGRVVEERRAVRDLATRYPEDVDLQVLQAQKLVEAGDVEAALAWLKDALGRTTKDQQSDLRQKYAQILDDRGRFKELAEFLAQWLRDNPEYSTPYGWYLATLARTDRGPQADAEAVRWLKEAQTPGEVPPAVRARLEAAVGYLTGNGHGLSTDTIPPRWQPMITEAFLALVTHPTLHDVAAQIWRDYRFRQSNAWPTTRLALIARVKAEVATLPAATLKRLVGLLADYGAATRAELWQALIDPVRQRWAKEGDRRARQALADALLTVLNHGAEAVDRLAFLRDLVRTAAEEQRDAYREQLFDALQGQPWQPALEDELLALLPQLGEEQEPAYRLFGHVHRLYRLVDRLVEGRREALFKDLKDPEKLSRTELAEKRREQLKAARQAVADRLAKELPKLPADLAKWATAERAYLDILTERNLDRAAQDAWAFLGAEPPGPPPAADEPDLSRLFDARLRQRWLVTVASLAARPSAAPAQVDRVLAYLRAGEKNDPANPLWKTFHVRFLTALDRVAALEALLQGWIRAGDPDSKARVTLGYLLAERGDVPAAIQLFEAVEAEDELDPAGYRALAGWYLAADRREPHDRAELQQYVVMPEQWLDRFLMVQLHHLQNAQGPVGELDKEVLLALRAVFAKSAAPQAYLHYLHGFYQQTHDFRLLAVLPDAVPGHTAEAVYPFITGMQGVLNEIRNEADVDQLADRLTAVRAQAKTPADQRALDLLEVQVRRRAAEVKNQPGPHVAAALAALKRAFTHGWAPGETVPMAEALHHLGAISQPELAQEQLRQLEALHRMQPAGSYERLQLAALRAETLHVYQRTAEAADLLQAGLTEYREKAQGRLPSEGQGPLQTLLTYLMELRQHTRAEQLLAGPIAQPLHAQQAQWLAQRRFELFHHALEHGGAVSAGQGPALYKALEDQVRRALPAAPADPRHELVGLLCQVYVTARQQAIAGVAEDLKAFAYRLFPEVQAGLGRYFDGDVQVVARTVHDLLGAREGLVFVLGQLEKPPAWLAYTRAGAWGLFARQAAEWRVEVKNLGDLEPRLLAVALAELRRDLEERHWRQAELFHRGPNNQLFWTAKADDFARVAEEVLKDHLNAQEILQHVADYLFDGLDRKERAVAVLADAHRRGVLDDHGQRFLVGLLRRLDRFAEMIPLLQALVARNPDHLEDRLTLMVAYARTNQPEALRKLYQATDAHFHAADRWNDHVAYRLGQTCNETGLHAEAAGLFRTLVDRRQRLAGSAGNGDQELANYYTGLATALSGLGKTAEAVDAACGAIVTWGPRHHQRTAALATLNQVLMGAKDLDAYAAALDKQSAASHQDSPIVRKALGQAFLEHGQPARAIPHLRLALELQPHDKEAQDALLKAYDDTGDKAAAAAQLLEAAQAARRDLELYEKLGTRFAELGRAAEAERAFTSIIEAQPTEADSHKRLAEVRQRQQRWAEAVTEWEQVARLQSLEPTGLLGLAGAQVHLQRWDDARATLRQLRARAWPPRFDKVEQETRELEKQLP